MTLIDSTSILSYLQRLDPPRVPASKDVNGTALVLLPPCICYGPQHSSACLHRFTAPASFKEAPFCWTDPSFTS